MILLSLTGAELWKMNNRTSISYYINNENVHLTVYSHIPNIIHVSFLGSYIHTNLLNLGEEENVVVSLKKK